MAYGAPNPALILPPPRVRSTTIEQYKKCLSCFMPNRDQRWRHGIGGNPKKSRAVNELIADMKRQKVRGRGIATSYHRRIYEANRDASSITGITMQTVYPCISLFQYQLFGRFDDICNFTMGAVKPHEVFDFDTQVSWSKNVREERSLDRVHHRVQWQRSC